MVKMVAKTENMKQFGLNRNGTRSVIAEIK
jgi:hypothetical protein